MSTARGTFDLHRRDTVWTSKLMVDGVWRGDILETPEIAKRRAAHFDGFRAASLDASIEPGRHHLYVSYACPFAHRVILARALTGLSSALPMSVLHPRWNTDDRWRFGETPFSTRDLSGNGFTCLHQAFSASRPDYTGRVTVPVLWDTVAGSIASDSSRHLVAWVNRMGRVLNPRSGVDLVPDSQRPDIEHLCDTLDRDIASGVYRLGGALDQAAYDLAEAAIFETLATLEGRLSDGRVFLHGAEITASDIVLFPILIRFEAVYRPLFRALRQPLCHYPALSRWLAGVLADDRVAATTRMDHILMHYYDGWAPRNPRIVPCFMLAAGRARAAGSGGPQP